jgi:hypothetical protein
MKLIAKLGIAAALATGCSYAETWTGKLVDATCFPKEEQPAKCDASKGTMNFGIQTADGKILKFDANGNIKTGVVLGGFPDAKGPSVMVTGTLMTVSASENEKVLKVDTIEIR